MPKTPSPVLQAFATLSQHPILTRQAELNPSDHVHPDLLAWCQQHPSIVVLNSGTLLTSEPDSELIQSCKVLLHAKNITPQQLLPAHPQLLQQLLDQASSASEDPAHTTRSARSVQQQRLRHLVAEAMALDASDIHLEVRDTHAQVRLRRHGELMLLARWPAKLAREIIAVAFNQETDHTHTHFNPLVPQNAAMPLELEGETLRLRLASLPAHQGFDVVMRLLRQSQQIPMHLDQLGYPSRELALLKKALRMPAGAIIIAGPTGSGKTTTLASCLHFLGTHQKIYAIEDPIEQAIAEATQIPVNTLHDERGFASMARTALRMDPDVIALGEMRDEQTAHVLMRAAITGHLVLSSVHAHSALEIPTRLIDLGVSRGLVANPGLLVCLVAQRLVPTLCERCAQSVTAVREYAAHLPRWHRAFGSMATLRARGPGCEDCHHQAIAGRRVVAEVIWLDHKGRDFIQAGDTLAWRHYLKLQGWRSYSEQLITLTQQGHVDPHDAEKFLGPIDPLEPTSFNYTTFDTVYGDD